MRRLKALDEPSSVEKVQSRLTQAGFGGGQSPQDGRMLDVGRAVYRTVLSEVDAKVCSAVALLHEQIVAETEEMVLEAGRAVGDELKTQILALVDRRLRDFMGEVLKALQAQAPPAPVVHVDVPRQAPPVVQVNAPRYAVTKTFEYNERDMPVAVREDHEPVG